MCLSILKDADTRTQNAKKYIHYLFVLLKSLGFTRDLCMDWIHMCITRVTRVTLHSIGVTCASRVIIHCNVIHM